MDKKQHRALIALYSVDVFLESYAERIPNTLRTGAYKQFTSTLAQMNLHVQTQHSAPLLAKGLTNLKDVKRKALIRNHLAPIVRIARLEKDRIVELAPFRMLRGEPSIHKLLAHARGVANVAEPYKNVFIEAGMKPTFIEDLTAAVDDILATITERRSAQGTHSSSTKAIDSSLRRCSRARDVLDSFVVTELHGQTDLLATWRTMKRVGRAMTSRRAQPEQEVPIPLPQPSAPSALPSFDSARLLGAGSA